ncbi:integral membrane protein [Zymoseptoria brevis]|uniref:Integral membrane protein n=1 Tax=Zymoseptoria brevis TaxID=1047168 RepID=A0A0F4GJR5_9PEZI|nr:integral membrane protein [Zymoseptoria brevis]
MRKLFNRLHHQYGLLADRLGISRRRLAGYGLVALVVFALTLHVRNASSSDPGSWFFNPTTGYSRKYSAIRQLQAERFIEAAESTPPYTKTHQAKGLCVGVPSIARDGARYLRNTVGSLLSGLSQQERDGVYFMVLIPHSDPSIHPAMHEPWLSNVVDEILVYNVSEKEMGYIESLEREDVEHRTKGLYDYKYLMEACYAKDTPYIALIEDDVIAMDGWYHRTVNAIQRIESLSGAKGFLYLRLFYTEEFLGWNNEHWPTYAFWSILFIAGSAALVHWLPVRFQWPRRVLTPRFSAVIAALVVPWMVMLVFAAGKVTVFPLPEGVNRMNNFGCCAQGFVFPRERAGKIIEWFESSRLGFADMLIEEYANKHNEQRWAITPSVLQHVGTKSSKPDDFGHGAKFAKSVAGTIWNFGFERLSSQRLHEEHEEHELSANGVHGLVRGVEQGG